jgi:hypothetical protein
MTTKTRPADTPLLPFAFSELHGRQVVADFSAGHLSSDGGVLFLRQIDRGLGVSRELAGCFHDARDPRFVEHLLPALLSQRLYALALGYEDLNDHADLRRDPLLAVAVEKPDPLGRDRAGQRDRGKPLAAASTLNRLEISNSKSTRYHKLQHDPLAVEACVLRLGVRCLPKHAREIILDLDATGDLVHGLQEGRFFHAYYGDYCYLPLYILAGDVPLWAQLRTAEHGAAHGALDALRTVVAAIRRRCRKARILVRTDSGFCNDAFMAWIESQPDLYYCLGLAPNARLIDQAQDALADARAQHCLTGVAARRFKELRYQTLKTWTRTRRVVAKAEVTPQGDNPRFVVTNLPADGFPEESQSQRFAAQALYEDFYCARGQCENVIKQQLLDLKADRTSTHHLVSNQLRVWFSTLAYLLLERLRTLGLHDTDLAKATVGTIRLKLLKVAAAVTVRVRRIYVQMPSAYPYQQLFARCHHRLMALAANST